MPGDDKKTGIARVVCLRFLNMASKTPEHGLLVKFKEPSLLQDMVSRNQLKSNDQRNEFQPTAGTFALLGEDDELYQRARFSFGLTVPLLWNLFCARGEGGQYDVEQLTEYGKTLHEAADFDKKAVELGLYLSSEFGILSPVAWSDDNLRVTTFGVSKYVVTMEDPYPVWEQRMEVARCTVQPRVFDFAKGFGYDGEPDEFDLGESFSNEGFWYFIHPSIVEEVRKRFMIREYADAVLAALQVVSQSVRDRTGLKEDGARLMAEAFSGDNPLLLFEDPLPLTQRALQSGYQQLFAGAMTGVRNPKAHSLVSIDRNRCIHFLFLASLLAYKLDEAVPAVPGAS